MGIGMLHPMHLFVIVLTMALLIAAGIGVARFLIRYPVRYNRQLEQESRSDPSRG